MRTLKEEDPIAFIIQTGDAVSHADSGHYKVFLNELAHSGLWLPMFMLPGNHDVDSDEEKLFQRYFSPKQLWFEYGGALFILADNSICMANRFTRKETARNPSNTSSNDCSIF